MAHSGIPFSCKLIEKALHFWYICFTGLIHSFEMDFFLSKTLEKASNFYKIILIKPIPTL